MSRKSGRCVITPHKVFSHTERVSSGGNASNLFLEVPISNIDQVTDCADWFLVGFPLPLQAFAGK
jgi:hypothetical protein